MTDVLSGREACLIFFNKPYFDQRTYVLGGVPGFDFVAQVSHGLRLTKENEALGAPDETLGVASCLHGPHLDRS
jgi:hypothetical protein